MKPSKWMGGPSARAALCAGLFCVPSAGAFGSFEDGVVSGPITKAANCVAIAGENQAATIVVDAKDYPVVQVAANLFADDVGRVTGHRPVVSNAAGGAVEMVIAGTLGHSALIERLAAEGRLEKLDEIKGRWEATGWQIVSKPFPGVQRALVIVGSDRRGTAYGLTRLSEKIGVSPWYWWADVPTRHSSVLAITVASPQVDAPAVKYRGFFINDEDDGFAPWARTTFEPGFKNAGPKTYAKVFELMLRLRLNYIWPAMHACSVAFGPVPENVKVADQYGIVAGASHCEPMLCNNVKWNEKVSGPWNYSLNRDTIHSYWENMAKARGADEAVWTLGIRGIHDRGMETPPKDMPGKISIVSQVIADERALLGQYVTSQWGPVAQCFVPYKEVQSIYDAGLEVPPDVTLVWADDNYGYIRRLSSPEERKRPGGAGFYYHLSYNGPPRSYLWINTTPPAFMWEEMHKAWENDARTLWMVNVGDIKPAEIGIDYYAHLAWNPEASGTDSQPFFLRSFAAQNFGPGVAKPAADFLTEYYRLGTIRKPELMSRPWAMSLTVDEAPRMEDAYRTLLKQEDALAAQIPPDARDAYTEMIGFPARLLGEAGLIFMADRHVQLGVDATANQAEMEHWRDAIAAQAEDFNTKIAGGKWNNTMPRLNSKSGTNWSSRMRWPWAEKPGDTPANPEITGQPPEGLRWRDAAAWNRSLDEGPAHWAIVSGLGSTGRAVALEPATLESSWSEGVVSAPRLEYDFQAKGGPADAYIDFLPAFRLVPGMKLRVALQVDDQAPQVTEVPGSSGKEDENGPVRRLAVQDNYVRLHVPLPPLGAGSHTFKISAMDPGAVIDRISLP
jgi:hypothetical protein